MIVINNQLGKAFERFEAGRELSEVITIDIQFF